MSLRSAGCFAEAIALSQQLVDTQPDEPRYLMALARAYLSAGRIPEARDAVERLQTIDGSPASKLFLGILLRAEGRTGEAIGYLQAAAAAAPRQPQLHIHLGAAYLSQRRWSDAEAAYRKAIEIDGDSAEAWYGLSVTYCRKREFEEALEYALRAVRLLHYFPAHFQMGAILSKLGWFREAAGCFEIGLGMMPDSPRAHRYLSILYNRVGEPQRAAAHHVKSRKLMVAR